MHVLNGSLQASSAAFSRFCFQGDVRSRAKAKGGALLEGVSKVLDIEVRGCAIQLNCCMIHESIRRMPMGTQEKQEQN